MILTMRLMDITKLKVLVLNVVTLELSDGVDISAPETAEGYCTKFKNVRLKRLADSNENI